MGMGWHTLAHESSELKSKRPCKCGKGFIYSYFVTTEESEYLHLNVVMRKKLLTVQITANKLNEVD